MREPMRASRRPDVLTLWNDLETLEHRIDRLDEDPTNRCHAARLHRDVQLGLQLHLDGEAPRRDAEADGLRDTLAAVRSCLDLDPWTVCPDEWQRAIATAQRNVGEAVLVVIERASPALR